MLYQHELTPGIIRNVSAIEIEGARFERVTRCKDCAEFKPATNFCKEWYELVSCDGYCSKAVSR